MVLASGRAAEARFAEQDVLQAIDDVGLRIADVESETNPLGELVEGRQDGARVDVRPPVGRDRQGATSEIDVGLGLGDQPGEARSICRAGRVVVDHSRMVTRAARLLSEASQQDVTRGQPLAGNPATSCYAAQSLLVRSGMREEEPLT